MDEVVLVDKKGRFKETREKEDAHKNPVILHRAISVLIFNKNKVLIQKRAKNKKTWPLYWANTCCSHPRKEESYFQAAKRRLYEEMGIKTPLKRAFRIIYQAKYNDKWGENEYDWVFVGEYKGTIRSDPKEVSQYKWVDLASLKKDIILNSQKYTPWFKLILERF